MATYRNIHDHSDIVKRPYHKSTKHHWMSAQERAAQFAPFSALGGHKEIISDKEKVFESKKQLDDDQKKIIDHCLRKLLTQKLPFVLVRITYFIPEINADSGYYHTLWGHIQKIDQFQGMIIMDNDVHIKIEDIYEIDIEE